MKSLVLPLSLAIEHFNFLPNNSLSFITLTALCADVLSIYNTNAVPLLSLDCLLLTIVILFNTQLVNNFRPLIQLSYFPTRPNFSKTLSKTNHYFYDNLYNLVNYFV